MRFGVREICDVTFKAAAANQKVGTKIFKKYQPVFMIDTAKTSNFEQASTTVYANGGRGNTRLLAWEGEKTMTFTVEDALMSPMGLAVLSGAGLINHKVGDSARVHATIEKNVGADGKVEITLEDLHDETGLDTAKSFTICDCIPMYATVLGSAGKESDFLEIAAIEAPIVVDATNPGVLTVVNGVEGTTVVVDFYLAMTNSVQTITIGPEDFGGYYYVEAQTLFRDEATGKDLAANITFPKVKIQSAFTFTMAASGDPSTFSFVMDALPGYTITRCNKKTMCDIQILSIAADEDDQCINCDLTKPASETPVFKDALVIAGSKISSENIPSSMPNATEAKANQDATVIEQEGNKITISERSGEQWVEYASSNPAQGTHEWVALDIDTGEDDITKVTFNGTQLTQADVDEAASIGLGAGHFVLWVKADHAGTEYPRTIVLGTKGKADTEIVIDIING